MEIQNLPVLDPTKTRIGNFAMSGGDGRQLNVNVDGGDNKDNVVGSLVQNFAYESIQEFQVLQHRWTAESGRSVGGVVNVISKSGSNELRDGLTNTLTGRFGRSQVSLSYVLAGSRSWGGQPTASYSGNRIAIAPDNQFARLPCPRASRRAGETTTTPRRPPLPPPQRARRRALTSRPAPGRRPRDSATPPRTAPA